MARAGKAIERELVDDGLGVGDLYEQVITRVGIQNAFSGHRPMTPRRLVAELFAIARVRQSHGLRPYPATSINGVAWLLVRNH